MSPFEFITVFVSLIVGFALAHILRAVSDLYEIRERVKTYWLNSLWVPIETPLFQRAPLSNFFSNVGKKNKVYSKIGEDVNSRRIGTIFTNLMLVILHIAPRPASTGIESGDQQYSGGNLHIISLLHNATTSNCHLYLYVYDHSV